MATIHIDGPIGVNAGELSARWLRGQMPTDGSEVVLQIHSEGGSVFEALAMMDIVKAYKGNVRAVVSSMALSAASLLLTACREVEVTANAYLMVHNPHMDDTDMNESERGLIASMSDRMVQLYAEKTRKPPGEIRRLMQAETFLNATESVRLGFADRVVDASKMAARATTRTIVAKAGTSTRAQWRAAVAACGGDFVKADRANPGLRLRLIREANAR